MEQISANLTNGTTSKGGDGNPGNGSQPKVANTTYMTPTHEILDVPAYLMRRERKAIKPTKSLTRHLENMKKRPEPSGGQGVGNTGGSFSLYYGQKPGSAQANGKNISGRSPKKLIYRDAGERGRSEDSPRRHTFIIRHSSNPNRHDVTEERSFGGSNAQNMSHITDSSKLARVDSPRRLSSYLPKRKVSSSKLESLDVDAANRSERDFDPGQSPDGKTSVRISNSFKCSSASKLIATSTNRALDRDEGTDSQDSTTSPHLTSDAICLSGSNGPVLVHQRSFSHIESPVRKAGSGEDSPSGMGAGSESNGSSTGTSTVNGPPSCEKIEFRHKQHHLHHQKRAMALRYENSATYKENGYSPMKRSSRLKQKAESPLHGNRGRMLESGGGNGCSNEVSHAHSVILGQSHHSISPKLVLHTSYDCGDDTHSIENTVTTALITTASSNMNSQQAISTTTVSTEGQSMVASSTSSSKHVKMPLIHTGASIIGVSSVTASTSGSTATSASGTVKTTSTGGGCLSMNDYTILKRKIQECGVPNVNSMLSNPTHLTNLVGLRSNKLYEAGYDSRLNNSMMSSKQQGHHHNSAEKYFNVGKGSAIKSSNSRSRSFASGHSGSSQTTVKVIKSVNSEKTERYGKNVDEHVSKFYRSDRTFKDGGYTPNPSYKNHRYKVA